MESLFETLEREYLVVLTKAESQLSKVHQCNNSDILESKRLLAILENHILECNEIFGQLEMEIRSMTASLKSGLHNKIGGYKQVFN